MRPAATPDPDAPLPPSPLSQFVLELSRRMAPAGASGGVPRPTIRNETELWEWIRDHLGVTIPRKRVCRGHRAPMEAVADAYFAVHSRTVWKASRGFGGKTIALGALGLAEAATLGAGVTLLGGSGEQSQRVHAYMRGEETMAGRFWMWPKAPRELLIGDPTARKTRLANGGWISALMASSRSVRGPHPQRVRGDEIDEMLPVIWDASQGQAMEANGVLEQVVGSSTLHYADGTMARELRMAAEHGWPVYEWCWRETSAEGGFVSLAQVERKQKSVTREQWNTEYDLQEPSVQGRAIDSEVCDLAFDPKLGNFVGAMGDVLQIEPPDPRAVEERHYSTGVDWGKLRDKTILWVNRTDVRPVRLVAFGHLGRIAYPEMIRLFEELLRVYPGPCYYDRGGIGTVIEDFLSVPAFGVNLIGLERTNLFQHWIVGLEQGDFRAPRVEYAWRAHKFCTRDDLYGDGHPPDTFVAGALAWKAALEPPLVIR